MDELTIDHDQFKQNIMEKTNELRYHSLVQLIDDWEQQSIDKIRRTSDDARQQLRNIINEHATKLTEASTKIADELRQARDDDEFFETDLKQWIDKLERLKKDLAHPLNIQFQQEDNSTIPFISKMIVVVPTKETFGRSIGTIQIEDNGRVIVKKQGSDYATARGKDEYFSGQHQFRFKIEERQGNKWIFIGIISKDVALQAISCKSQSSYGWAGNSQVFLNGALHNGTNGYKSDIAKNDIVQLLIDCDQRIIRLTNERTRSVYELRIETSKCPFPWQFHFNLHYSNDRIRIL
jgi:hypothetical protein